jgi:ketosteroid isomerase-like protein
MMDRMMILPRTALLGLLGAAALAASVPSPALAAINTTPEEASRAMDKAIVAGDGATLDRLIAPDFLWIREGGARTGKAAFVHGLATPGLKIEPFTPSEGRWLKSGDLAVFSAVNELHGSESGEAFVDKHNFVDVWRRDAEGWRLVYTQVTKAPEPGK